MPRRLGGGGGATGLRGSGKETSLSGAMFLVAAEVEEEFEEARKTAAVRDATEVVELDS